MPSSGVENRTISTITSHVVSPRKTCARPADFLQIHRLLFSSVEPRAQAQQGCIGLLQALSAYGRLFLELLAADDAGGRLHVRLQGFLLAHLFTSRKRASFNATDALELGHLIIPMPNVSPDKIEYTL